MEPTRWQAWGRHLAAGLGAAVISLFAFILREPVPVFDWVDLGVHELGHMLVMAGPRMFHFVAGSLSRSQRRVVPCSYGAEYRSRRRPHEVSNAGVGPHG